MTLAKVHEYPSGKTFIKAFLVEGFDSFDKKQVQDLSVQQVGTRKNTFNEGKMAYSEESPEWINSANNDRVRPS